LAYNGYSARLAHRPKNHLGLDGSQPPYSLLVPPLFDQLLPLE